MKASGSPLLQPEVRSPFPLPKTGITSSCRDCFCFLRSRRRRRRRRECRCKEWLNLPFFLLHFLRRLVVSSASSLILSRDMLGTNPLYSPFNCLDMMWILSTQYSFLITQASCFISLNATSSKFRGLTYGYPTFKGQVLNGGELLDLIEGLRANNLLYYTHLLTGYIGSVSFLNAVLEVVEKLRSINPALTYVCDPVLGDEGKLYVPHDLVSVYRKKVIPVASMLTPNQFEAEQLTGYRINSEKDGLEACNFLHGAGPSKVVITSLHLDNKLLLIGSHQISKNLLPQQFKIVIPKIPAYFTGTGDLLTSLLLGWSNKYPDDLDKASELAVSSLQAVLHRTVTDYEKAGFDPKSSSLEIRLIQSQEDIRNPEVNYRAERYS